MLVFHIAIAGYCDDASLFCKTALKEIAMGCTYNYRLAEERLAHLEVDFVEPH